MSKKATKALLQLEKDSRAITAALLRRNRAWLAGKSTPGEQSLQSNPLRLDISLTAPRDLDASVSVRIQERAAPELPPPGAEGPK